MSRINLMSLPYQAQFGRRLYIVQITGKHCVGTEFINVLYDRNGNEWLAVKEEVEKNLAFMLDDEPHMYNLCRMKLEIDKQLDFDEIAKDMAEMEEGNEVDSSAVDHNFSDVVSIVPAGAD